MAYTNIETSCAKILNLQGNDTFTQIPGLELQEIIFYLNRSFLELRNTLKISNNLTFGLELEFEEAKIERIERAKNQNISLESWHIKSDASLTNGAEITSPILYNTKENWKQLKSICNIVKKNALIGKNSGGHIHIGTDTLGVKKESWMNLLKIWSVYENIFYRFLYGEYLNGRPNILRYATPISQKFWECYLSLENNDKSQITDALEILKQSRYQAINFRNVNLDLKEKENNTIEFRAPNGTLEASIWQNNVNTLIHLLLIAKHNKLDEEQLEKRKMLASKYNTLEWYNEIYLQQALELCDILFQNNLDKLYFLKQYFKTFEVDSNWKKGRTLVK